MSVNQAINLRQLNAFAEQHQLPNETIVAYAFWLGNGVVLTDKRLVKVDLKVIQSHTQAIPLSDIRSVKNQLMVARVRGSELYIDIKGTHKNSMVKAIQALQIDSGSTNVAALQQAFVDETQQPLPSMLGNAQTASTAEPVLSHSTISPPQSDETTIPRAAPTNPTSTTPKTKAEKGMPTGVKVLLIVLGIVVGLPMLGGIIAGIFGIEGPDYEAIEAVELAEAKQAYQQALTAEQQKTLTETLYEDIVQVNANDQSFKPFIGQRIKWFARIEDIHTSKKNCELELTSRKRAPMSPNIFVELPCHAWDDIKANIDTLYKYIEIVGTIEDIDSAFILPDVHLRYPEIIVDSETAIAYQVAETRKAELEKIESKLLGQCANQAEIAALRNNWKFEYGDRPADFFVDKASDKPDTYVMLYYWKVLNAFGVYMGKTTRCEFGQDFIDGATTTFQVETTDRGVLGR